MNRIEILGCLMDAGTMDETVSCIKERLDSGVFTQHVAVNVAKIVNMKKDLTLAQSVAACDLINIDGMGVVWGARILGEKVPERVAGIDLFERLLQLAGECGYPVYFLGGTDKVVERTVSVVKEKYLKLKVAGFHNGYFWENEDEIVRDIRASGARMLFVAITSPKKENFINKWKHELCVDFVMGVGGTFDVIAGKVRRAPLWMQRSGLEWLFRVFQEPKRMWRRYLITNAKFAVLMCRSYFSLGRN